MIKNLKGEFALMDSMNLKPNYAVLGRKYGIERIGTYLNFNLYRH